MALPQPFVFDPYSVAVQENPYPFYKVLRDGHPLYWCASANTWALSRYDDIAAACSDPARFSSARGNVLDDDPARMGNTLGTSDPPKHDRLRGLVNAAFMRGRVLEREAQLRSITREYVDEFVSTGGGDLIQNLTARISTSTICDILGFERADHVQLKKWVDGLVYRDPVTRQLPPSGHEARKAMVAYASTTIEARRVEPRDDLISALIAAEVEGSKLTPADMMHTVATLLGAGIESASSFIGNAMLALSEHPEQAALLASELAMAPQAIEEMLRYDTPTQRFHRTATQDIELHGQTIRAGQSVLVMYGSANRDDRKFPDPERFDLTRTPGRHLAMGHGTHFCLGAQLAKAMSRIFLEEWFQRVASFTVHHDRVVRMHSPVFRGLSSMPVSVTRH
ncbi:MAG: cytochrome P450 [Burkholderiales bacterium]|nr:cytochrome P450 [Burkholderiales bacterium]